jgi:hypothetical protein
VQELKKDLPNGKKGSCGGSSNPMKMRSRTYDEEG